MAIPEDVAVVRVAWTKHGDERECEGERAGRGAGARVDVASENERGTWIVRIDDRRTGGVSVAWRVRMEHRMVLGAKRYQTWSDPLEVRVAGMSASLSWAW